MDFPNDLWQKCNNCNMNPLKFDTSSGKMGSSPGLVRCRSNVPFTTFIADEENNILLTNKDSKEGYLRRIEGIEEDLT